MENRIKEQQLDLFADRTSCHRWWPNQFRLLLSSLAYMLLEAIRRLALKGTELANAYVGTLRLKLLKVGAVIRIPGESVFCSRVLVPTSDCSSTLQPGSRRDNRQLLIKKRVETTAMDSYAYSSANRPCSTVVGAQKPGKSPSNTQNLIGSATLKAKTGINDQFWPDQSCS